MPQTRPAVFIDLPNFYGQLIRTGIGEPKAIREYLTNWLEIDQLATKLVGEDRDVWVFYSGNKLGPSNDARISGRYMNDYIGRINRIPGVTAYDVDIPGEQREVVSFECTHCGIENTAHSHSEKGVDAALAAHMFDTMDSWDEAMILSGDADFVPVVRMLRRRGKIVRGSGFEGASPALLRECYSYHELLEEYLSLDFAFYDMIRSGGIIYQWFSLPNLHTHRRPPESNILHLEARVFCSSRKIELVMPKRHLDKAARAELLNAFASKAEISFRERGEVDELVQILEFPHDPGISTRRHYQKATALLSAAFGAYQQEEMQNPYNDPIGISIKKKYRFNADDNEYLPEA